MQNRLLSLFKRQEQYSQSPEENSLDQWLNQKNIGFICKSTPRALLMHWFQCDEINASTVPVYMKQLENEIQTYEHLPMGFVKLVKRWWHDITRKENVLNQYNVITQSAAQQRSIVRMDPKPGVSSDNPEGLVLRTGNRGHIAPLARIGSLEHQNDMIMGAAYSLQNRLCQVAAAQQQQQIRIDNLSKEQETRGKEQQDTKQKLAQLAEVVAQIQAYRRLPTGDGRHRPSSAATHGLFATSKEASMPLFAAAARPVTQRLSSTEAD